MPQPDFPIRMSADSEVVLRGLLASARCWCVMRPNAFAPGPARRVLAAAFPVVADASLKPAIVETTSAYLNACLADSTLHSKLSAELCASVTALLDECTRSQLDRIRREQHLAVTARPAATLPARPPRAPLVPSAVV